MWTHCETGKGKTNMPVMGRRRKTDRHLPQRVYIRRGKFYFVTAANKWLPLGENYPQAMAAWARLLNDIRPTYTMADLFDRYMLEIAPTKAKATYLGNQKEIKPLRVFFRDLKPEEIEPIQIYQYQDIRGK
jgi:hypothetical protein